MKTVYLLALALALPIQANALDTESVYAWGAWSQNIQPAAGPVAVVTPSPVTQPSIEFRQNENASFNRIDVAARTAAQAADAAAQAAADAAAQAAADAAAEILNNLAQAAAANNSTLISGVGVVATPSIDVNATPSL
jgi:hypothetical protein